MIKNLNALADYKILEVKDLLVKHEVEKYFEYIPLDVFRGTPVKEVITEVSKAVTREVMLVLDQLSGSEYLLTKDCVEEEVSQLVKLAIVDYMLLFDCLLEINYNE